MTASPRDLARGAQEMAAWLAECDSCQAASADVKVLATALTEALDRAEAAEARLTEQAIETVYCIGDLAGERRATWQAWRWGSYWRDRARESEAEVDCWRSEGDEEADAFERLNSLGHIKDLEPTE